MNERTCFDILRISRDASLADAKDAYRQLVKRWHPDQYAKYPEKQMIAHEKLKEINIAYRDIIPILKKSMQDRAEKLSVREETYQPKEEPKPPARSVMGMAFWNRVGLFINAKILHSNRLKVTEGDSSLPPGQAQRESTSHNGGERRAAPDFEQVLKRAVSDRRPGGGGRKRRGSRNRTKREFERAPLFRAGTQTKHRTGERVEKITPVRRVNPIGGD